MKEIQPSSRYTLNLQRHNFQTIITLTSRMDWLLPAEWTGYQQNGLEQILNKISQNDQRGTYLVVPIKQKKSKNDDDDDVSTWECPYCGTINLASNNTCSNESCPLYRKKGRNWDKN